MVRLEALILGMTVASIASPAYAEPCDTSPIAVIGNSHIVSLNSESRKRYAQNWGVVPGNLLMEDSFGGTSGMQRCRRQRDTSGYGRDNNCDIMAFIGRNISDIKNDLPFIHSELERAGSHRVILYEGTNSLSTGRRGGYASARRKKALLRQVRKNLAYIVGELHRQKVRGEVIQVYIAELQNSLAGSSPLLDWYTIGEYNKLIHQVGADGVIDTAETPMKPSDPHGYVEETFPFLLARFHEALNPSCGYARLSSDDYLRISYDRAAGRIKRNDYSRKVYEPYLRKVASGFGRR